MTVPSAAKRRFAEQAHIATLRFQLMSADQRDGLRAGVQELRLRWLHKKQPDARMRDIAKQYGWHKPRQRTLRWRDSGTVPVSLSAIRVARYQQGSDPGPAYA